MLVTPLKSLCKGCSTEFAYYLYKNHPRGVQYDDLMKMLKKVNTNWRMWTFDTFNDEHIRIDCGKFKIEKEYDDLREIR